MVDVSDSRKKADWPVVAAMVLAVALVAPLALYVGGYFALAKTTTGVGPRKATERLYDSAWQFRIFQPAAKVEAFLTGTEIITGFPVE
jgi:hypothetical protein